LGRHTYPRAILTILGLTVAYAILGRLSVLLAIPPGYATAIWPPAGLALAGVLVGGPGVAGHLARVISGQFLAYP
jgi:integral membrane sensor domain MASE1